MLNEMVGPDFWSLPFLGLGNPRLKAEAGLGCSMAPFCVAFLLQLTAQIVEEALLLEKQPEAGAAISA